MTFSHLLPGSRDPSSLLAETMKAWGGHGDIWVFGYASLIWRPEFECRRAAAGHASTAGIARCRCARASTAARPSARASCSRWCTAARAAARSTASPNSEVPMPSSSASGRARCRPASTTRSGCPAAPPRAACKALAFTLQPKQPEPHRPGARRADWSRSCAPRTAATAAPSHYLMETAASSARLRHPRPRRRAPGRARAPPRPHDVTARSRPRAADRGVGGRGRRVRSRSRSASVSISTSTPGSSTSRPNAG